MSVDPKWLGLALVARRKELGMGRPDLASSASLSYPFVAELEKGRKVPSADALELLAGALEMRPEDLRELADRMASQDAMDAKQGARSVDRGGAQSLSTKSELDQGDQVEALTAEVMKRIEPIVRAAISQALEGGIN